MASSPTTDVDDLPILEDLKSLSAIGTEKNSKRGLLKLLDHIGFQPDEFRLPLCLSGSKKRSVTLQKQPFILPHMWFSTLHCMYKDAFQALLGHPGAIKSFWESQLGNPNISGHPMVRRPNWMSKAIPVILHGDAVPVTGVGKSWGKSSLVISWCSLLGRGTTIASHFLIFAIINTMFASGSVHNTMRSIWRVIAWSFEQAFAGKHPTTDLAGIPFVTGSAAADKSGSDLADGFFLVLWAIRGDLDFWSKDCCITLQIYTGRHLKKIRIACRL